MQGEAPAVEGPDEPEGEPAQAEASSPPPAEPGIGEDGAIELGKQLAEIRKQAAPRVIPPGTVAVAGLAGVASRKVPEDYTTKEAAELLLWAHEEAKKMPRGGS